MIVFYIISTIGLNICGNMIDWYDSALLAVLIYEILGGFLCLSAYYKTLKNERRSKIL